LDGFGNNRFPGQRWISFLPALVYYMIWYNECIRNKGESGMSEKKEKEVFYVRSSPIAITGRALAEFLKENGDTQISAAYKTGVPQPKMGEFKNRKMIDPNMIASLMIRYNLNFWELFPIEELREYPEYMEDREELKQEYRYPHVHDIANFQMKLAEFQKKVRETIPDAQLGDFEMVIEEKDGELTFRMRPKK
jgi:hypothetical protein